MKTILRLVSTPARTVVFVCCGVVCFVAAVDASEAILPATTSGYAQTIVSQSGRGYYKVYGDLVYGAVTTAHWAAAEHSFLKFDMRTLPDSFIGLSVTLEYYQYYHANSPPEVNVRLIQDPVRLGAEALFWELDGAPALTGYAASQDGLMSRPLDSAIGRVLDSCRVAGSMSIGVCIPHVYNTGPGQAYGNNGSLPPCLRIVYVGPYETDIQAVRAESVTYPLVAGASQLDTALLVLTNRGMQTSDYFWVYAAAPGLQPESAHVGMIAVGETVSVRVPLPPPESADRFVDYRLWSACLSDPLPANDSTALRCWVFPRGTYAAEGFDDPTFPAPGWVTANNDSGAQCWQWRADSGRRHSEAGFTMCAREQGMDNDDWLISGPVCPQPDDRDSLGYFTCAYQTGTTQMMYVWALSGQSVSDTVAWLTYSQPSSPSWTRKAISLDRFDGDTVYIGFQDLSGFDWNGLCLDDIWFSRTYVPGASEPKPGEASPPDFSIEPSVTVGRFVTVRYNGAARTRSDLTLRDVLGRTVRSFALTDGGLTRLDLRGLSPGVYVATLEGNPAFSRKLIIR